MAPRRGRRRGERRRPDHRAPAAEPDQRPLRPHHRPRLLAPYLEGGDRGLVQSPRQVVAQAVAHPPVAAPGAAWNYSNTNYLVAGLVIEAVTGRSAGREIHDRLLAPLGLTHTTLPLTDPEIHGPHLHGYDLDQHDMTTFSPSYDWTAGAMISTLDDLARFDRALFTGRLLAPAEQRELETVVQLPDLPGYALGVQRSTVDCQGRLRPRLGDGRRWPGLHQHLPDHGGRDPPTDPGGHGLRPRPGPAAPAALPGDGRDFHRAERRDLLLSRPQEKLLPARS